MVQNRENGGWKIEDRADSSSHDKGRGQAEMFHVERFE
jgi:hypothetical protein